jgi:hypothetical protein
LSIEIIDPIEYHGWDDLVLATGQPSVFYTAAWARVLHDTYDYIPLYFTVFGDESLSALIPVMEISSVLTGKRGVSLPFTDACQPIACSEGLFDESMRSAAEYGKRAGWKYLELRGGVEGLRDAPVYTYHFSHELDLNRSDEVLWSKLRRSTRHNINYAEKSGLTVKICRDWQSLNEFYVLNCATRRFHGLPPQPKFFFRNVFEHVISDGKGFVVLAYHQNKAIAGATFFHFGEKAVYKYGASYRRFLKMRPNNLIMWEAIKWFRRAGFEALSFGRTAPENEGLLRFKRGWGTDERKLNYYRYDLKRNVFCSKKSKLKNSYAVFKRMPLPLLRMTGRILYRHMG